MILGYANAIVCVLLLSIGLGLLIGGIGMMSLSEIVMDFTNVPKPSFFDETKKDYEHSPNVKWIDNILVIREPQEDDFLAGSPIFFRVHVSTTEYGEDVVAHIFHEELKETFTTLEDSNLDFNNKTIVQRLDRHLTDNVFYVNLILNDPPTCDRNLDSIHDQNPKDTCLYGYNANKEFSFNEGNYFLHISFLTNDTIKGYTSPISILKIPDPRENWITESISQIIQILRIQSLEIKHAEGQALAGIGAGLILSSIPLGFNARKIFDDIKKTQDLINDDFQALNNLTLSLKNNIEHTLEELWPYSLFLDHILNRIITPLEFYYDHIRILRFSFWESSSIGLRDLSKEEQKKIVDLHNFILSTNDILLPQGTESLTIKIENILNSNIEEDQKRRNICEYLKNIYQNNLDIYSGVNHDIKSQLEGIKWIKFEK